MKDKDRRKFASLMKRLRVTFPIGMTDDDEALRTEVYWEEFKDEKIEIFEAVVGGAIKSCLFFPKPAELHEFINREYEARQKNDPGVRQIEWQEPTEEGKNLALEMMKGLKEKWDKEDEKDKKERDKRFEQRRKELKKQAKLLMERNGK